RTGGVRRRILDRGWSVRSCPSSFSSPWSSHRSGPDLARASGLLDELRLQLHRPEAIDLAVDVVVLVDQANLPDLGTGLECRAGALDLEVLDDDDGVTVGQHVADGVAVHHRVLAGTRRVIG